MTSDRGFSLLEVLVAFTILALSLGALMQIYSGSLRNTDITREQAQAVALAQSLLASAGVDEPLAEGGKSGDAGDRFRWQIQYRPYAEAPPPGSLANLNVLQPAVNLWLITARVSWAGSQGDTRAIALETLRAQKPPTP
ncbi:MAG: prepilin-type N-terminal cleavage/methylation domain-containing protein [Rhodocyclaceae bacterium]|nr:prepilin-type N-terminal cleavage/methylation domain-containing protein [Rhodocyclaceae bacterium]MBK9954606.1 prepilin-type N-terminal cleavage/methylation domain-containing protein [Rhodocyclaceae bacterium]